MSIVKVIYEDSTGLALEEEVYNVLSKLKDINKFYVIPSLQFNYGTGSTQIDAIVVTKCKIYVIEVKDISGSVYGNAKNDTVDIYNGEKKYSKYNPVKQNTKHILIFRKFFKISYSIPIVNVVIFGKRTKKVKIYNNDKYIKIMSFSEFKSFFLAEIEENENLVSYLNVRKLSLKIISESKNNVKARKNHKSFVRNRISKK